MEFKISRMKICVLHLLVTDSLIILSGSSRFHFGKLFSSLPFVLVIKIYSCLPDGRRETTFRSQYATMREENLRNFDIITCLIILFSII